MGTTVSRESAASRERGSKSAVSVERASKRRRAAANDDGMRVVAASTSLLARPGSRLSSGVNELPEFCHGTVSPKLSAMPAALLVHIFRFLTGPNSTDDSNLVALLSLDRTCRSLHDLLGNDATWGVLFPGLASGGFQGHAKYEYRTTIRERAFIPRAVHEIRQWGTGKGDKSKDNIIAWKMGGADGVRCIAEQLLARMRPDESIAIYKAYLRGDSVAYLTEVIQAHVIMRLEKALRISIMKLRPGDSYPEIRVKDIQDLDELNYDEHCCVSKGSHKCIITRSLIGRWVWPADNCCETDILGVDDRVKLVRALAYRAGVVKMSGEAFSLVATEILHYMGVIVAHAFEASMSFPIGIDYDDEDDDSSMEDASLTGQEEENIRTNYLADHCPPVREDDDGKLKCVIIPRQIEAAAVRMGMQPLLGFEYDFGNNYWVTSNDEKEKMDEEREEAHAQYESENESEPEPESDESSVISLLESFDSDGENNRA